MKENHEKYNTDKLRVNILQNRASRMSSAKKDRETPLMVRPVKLNFETASPKKLVDVTTLFQDDSTAYSRGAAFTTAKRSYLQEANRAAEIGVSPLRAKCPKP